MLMSLNPYNQVALTIICYTGQLFLIGPSTLTVLSTAIKRDNWVRRIARGRVGDSLNRDPGTVGPGARVHGLSGEH